MQQAGTKCVQDLTQLSGCYGDILHDVTAWTFPDTKNSDWLDKRV